MGVSVLRILDRLDYYNTHEVRLFITVDSFLIRDSVKASRWELLTRHSRTTYFLKTRRMSNHRLTVLFS